MDKKRKISSVMEPYIRNVLERDKIPYRSTVKNDGFVFYMPLTNRQFTEVLEDAPVSYTHLTLPTKRIV